MPRSKKVVSDTPRYIGADELIKKIFPYEVVDKKLYYINAQAVYDVISKAPTADVVPKSEVEELIKENESFAKTVNEASDLIRKLKSKIVPREELAREIFEEIAKIKKEYANGDIDADALYVRLYLLEKKYTGERHGTTR